LKLLICLVDLEIVLGQGGDGPTLFVGDVDDQIGYRQLDLVNEGQSTDATDALLLFLVGDAWQCRNGQHCDEKPRDQTMFSHGHTSAVSLAEAPPHPPGFRIPDARYQMPARNGSPREGGWIWYPVSGIRHLLQRVPRIFLSRYDRWP
jgi:hypothetical protein